MNRKELQNAVEEKAAQAVELGNQALTAARGYVDQAGDIVVPLAQDAVTKGAQVTADALENLQPHLDDALARIAPAIEVAREKMNDELLPKVSEALHEVAERVAVKDAAEQIAVAAAAVAGKEVVVKKKRSRGRTFLIIGAVAASLAGAVLLVKKLTESKSGWEQHQPSAPTPPPTFNAAQASADMTAEGAPAPDEETAETPVAEDAEAAVEEVTEQVDEHVADEPAEDVAESEDADDAAPAADETAGGDEPFRA